MQRLIILLLGLSMTGCVTYQKCLDKFGNQVTDTTYVTKNVTVTIPKDSAVVRLRTDTTHVVVKERQGRATVTVIRTPVETIAKAECDSIIKPVLVKVPCPPQLEVGVNPIWRVAALICGGLLLMSWMGGIMFIVGTRFAPIKKN